MKNEFQKHKTGDAIKWIAVAIAITLLAVSVAAALTQGFTNSNPYGWLDKECEHEFTDGVCAHCGEKEPAEEDPAIDVDAYTSLMSSVSKENGVMLHVSEATASAEASVIGTKSITAVVESAYEENKVVDWSVVWANPDSAWATGKTVTDYVNIIPASDGARTATINLYAPFGEQILIECV